MKAKIKRKAGHCKRHLLLLIAAGSNLVTDDNWLGGMDFSFSDMLSVVMVNDHSDFQYATVSTDGRRSVGDEGDASPPHFSEWGTA